MDNQGRTRYKTIFELAPDVIYTLSPEGVITSLSPSFERITGWKTRDWVGKNFVGIIYPEDLPVALKKFNRSLKNKRNLPYELRIVGKSGQALSFEFSSAPDIVDGKFVGQVGVARDVTKVKTVEKLHRHYANLIHSSDSAIISRDLSGIILTWNKGAEKVFGYKESEILGKNISILFEKGKDAELTRANKVIKRGKVVEDFEAIRVTKDGKRVPVIAKISPIRNERGKIVGLSSFLRDNTRKVRQMAGEKYITRATKILSSSLDYSKTLKKLAQILVPELADWSAVHVINDEGKLEQLAVAHIDPAKVKWALDLQMRMAKKANEERSRRNLERLKSGKSQFFPRITPDLLDKMVKNKEDRKIVDMLGLVSTISVPLISGRKVVGSMSLVSTNENRIYDAGDLRLAQEFGRLAGHAVENAKLYYEARAEIKKRKKIEEELKASREQLSVILANVSDGIMLYNEFGEVVFVNQASAAAAGYPDPKAFISNPKKWNDTFEMKDESGRPLSPLNTPGRRAFREKQAVTGIINATNKKTGEEFWSIIRANPVFDEAGEMKAVVSITHDITQRKELDRNKDDFISIASHELKTPVTSIKGYVHLLKSKSRDNEELVNYLGKVDIQLERLTDLIQDLLDISGMQSGRLSYRMEKFDIGNLVDEVVEGMREADRHHSIVLRDGLHKKVTADRSRISQVLVNLISNAAKYSPKNDKIVVELKDLKTEVEVEVKDSGIGIAKDEFEKIFDRFYRVKDVQGKTYPGLGVGLYLSREIAQKHHGRLWVESKKGRGSIFHFTLPKNSHTIDP